MGTAKEAALPKARPHIQTTPSVPHLTSDPEMVPVGYDPFDGTQGNGVAAEAYIARLHWRVVPLWWPTARGCACPRGQACPSVGKHPILQDWSKTATTDRATVRTWWTRWPKANVGLATGRASGFVVLDCDPRHGSDESLKGWASKHGPLPDGPIALTGGGGTHYLFAYPASGIGNAVNLAPGLDFRGDGGLIVAPPSVHASGRRYAWEASAHPMALALPALPAWAEPLVRRSRPVHTVADKTLADDPPWLASVLDGRIAEGGRNDTLARLFGYLLCRRVDARLAARLVAAINDAACVPPLEVDEVRNIIRSIAGRELARRGGGPRG